ncbi:hypothetical protein [Pseudoalteromonas luteoviolacea]|uniref:Uncharacterized protein n=1 Tax=Pseudoalteromonas luteoviolacea NCIMB 1942 TaxID=1365253 RepID=A0A166ZWU0_9GAMM|nr:hypothetical protein [Pseudoalteromonas luteoviolacea]KZN44748.1 hypothetical protein N482_15785 [Pseudoalteromonas luteoviolacea NCIMB 1942]
MKVIAILFAATLIMYLTTHVLDAVKAEILYVSVIVFIGIWFRININIAHICALLASQHIVSIIIFHFNLFPVEPDAPWVWHNARAFTIHFILDLILFFAIGLRPAISRWIKRHLDDAKQMIYMTNADITLLSIFGLFMLVDGLALVENFLRNLRYLGITGPLSTYFQNWTGVYYNYELIKSFILGLEMIAVLSIIKPSVRKKYHFKQPFKAPSQQNS